MNDVELEAWKAFVLVMKNFLGNNKARNYVEIVTNMLTAFRNLGYNITTTTTTIITITTTTNILRPFFPLLWELTFCYPWQSPPFHSILCIISHQTSNLHVSLNHFLPCHLWSSPTSAPFYSHIHTLLHPIIPLLPQHVAHPSQPAASHYITNLFNAHTLPQLSICLLLSQWHSAHPSHHSHFSSLKFCFLLSIHCPCFTSKFYHWTLNTCPIHFPFQPQCHLLTCQSTWQLSKLFPATSYSLKLMPALILLLYSTYHPGSRIFWLLPKLPHSRFKFSILSPSHLTSSSVRHILHLKLWIVTKGHMAPLHLLWTHPQQSVHWIEFASIPFPHTAYAIFQSLLSLHHFCHFSSL